MSNLAIESHSFIRYRRTKTIRKDALGYPDRLTKPDNWRVAQQVQLYVFLFSGLFVHLEILMEVRLSLDRRGNGIFHGIHVLNDTGSDIMTLIYTDLMAIRKLSGIR